MAFATTSLQGRSDEQRSWDLQLAPEELRNYVVVHELCHLREPSHSKVFWRFLGAATPGWQQRARWLREHGLELHGYDAATALANAPRSVSGLPSRARKLHKRLHTHHTFDSEQVGLNENR